MLNKELEKKIQDLENDLYEQELFEEPVEETVHKEEKIVFETSNRFYDGQLKENGQWIIKAKSYTPDQKESVDLPRYKIISEYEKELKTSYSKTLKSMMQSLISKIDDIHSESNK